MHYLFVVQGVNGQSSTNGGTNVGIVAAVNPNSNISLYNGSGDATNNSISQASVFTAAQSAIWDPTSNWAAVTSNSFGDSQSMAPNSPFYNAYWQLFIDAVS